MAGEELRAEKLLATDPEGALGLLLQHWSKSYDPALGRLIEDLGANVAEPLEGLPIKKGERAAELAKRVPKTAHRDRTALLTAFEDFAREAPGGMVWPSVEAWAEAKPDPRVARMALRVLTSSAHDLTAKLWRRLVNCIEAHGDLGVVEDAREYEAKLISVGGGWGFSPERFSNVLKKLSKSRQCKTPADAEVIARMKARVSSRATAPRVEDTTAMIEAIAANPDDDGPRLVYADWLVERKQPLGEFIVLQIGRKGRKTSTEARKREADLLATHRTTLLGPFDGVMAKSGLRFERGFLIAGRATEPVPAHPFTRLLKRIEFEDGFEKGARFDSLEEAVGPDLRQRSQLPAVAPKLTSWDVDADEWDALLKSVSKLQLESLALRNLVGVSLASMLPQLYARAPRLQTLALSLGASVTPRLVLADSLRSITVRYGEFEAIFTRGKGAWEGALTAGYYPTPEATAKWFTDLLSVFPDRGLASVKLVVRDDRFDTTVQAVRRAAAQLSVVRRRY